MRMMHTCAPAQRAPYTHARQHANVSSSCVPSCTKASSLPYHHHRLPLPAARRRTGGNVSVRGSGPVQSVWLVGNEQHAFDNVPDLSKLNAGTVNKQAGHWYVRPPLHPCAPTLTPAPHARHRHRTAEGCRSPPFARCPVPPPHGVQCRNLLRPV